MKKIWDFLKGAAIITGMLIVAALVILAMHP